MIASLLWVVAFVAIAASVWLFKTLAWSPFTLYRWFRDTEPPEPTYDPDARAPRFQHAAPIALFTGAILGWGFVLDLLA